MGRESRVTGRDSDIVFTLDMGQFKCVSYRYLVAV